MTFQDLKTADAALRGRILEVNAESVVETSPLDAARLDWLLQRADIALARPDGRAFVLCFGPGAPHDSVNYAWVSARHDAFVYVDRIVVGRELRGTGVGRALYGAVIAVAQAHGVPVLCEVNMVPPNPGSDAFHAAMGFAEAGQAEMAPGRRVRYMIRPPAGDISQPR